MSYNAQFAVVQLKISQNKHSWTPCTKIVILHSLVVQLSGYKVAAPQCIRILLEVYMTLKKRRRGCYLHEDNSHTSVFPIGYTLWYIHYVITTPPYIFIGNPMPNAICWKGTMNYNMTNFRWETTLY